MEQKEHEGLTVSGQKENEIEVRKYSEVTNQRQGERWRVKGSEREGLIESQRLTH